MPANGNALAYTALLVMPLLCAWPVAAHAECVVAGCHAELCVHDSAFQSGICAWQDAFICYQLYGSCSFIPASGQCGWVQDESLVSCLQDPSRHLQVYERMGKQFNEE